MPLMRTVEEHLHRCYGIDGDIEVVPKGRANNYRISSEGTRWLFKVLQPEYTTNQIASAARFIDYLAGSGYPVQPYVRSHEGAQVTVLERRAAVLIPWIDGDTDEPNMVVSGDVLGQIGALCGWLHRLGSLYPAGETLQWPASTKDSPHRVADKRATLIELAAQTQDAEIKDEIA